MSSEDLVKDTVVQYFSTPRFNEYSVQREGQIQFGSRIGFADVVLLDSKKNRTAIVECKGIGYVDNGIEQLKSYLSATATPLGVFANSINPDEWKFYKNLGANQFKEISQFQFEARILKTGIIGALNSSIRRIFTRRKASDLAQPEPNQLPIPPAQHTPYISYTGGNRTVENENRGHNIADPSLNGKPYYSEQNGFYWATNHRGIAECVPPHIKRIIHDEEIEIASTRGNLEDEINQLRNETTKLEEQKLKLEQDINQKVEELAHKNEEYTGLEVVLQAPTETELNIASVAAISGETTPLKQSKSSLVLRSIFPIFTTVALIGLLCYLFIFYASAGDKAFSSGKGSVQQQLNEIVNHGALSQAWLAGDWFVLTFPFIFLILAIVTHLGIEHRSWGLLAVPLVITFGLDATIAIKISQNIHDDKVIRGLIEESGKWTILDLNILAVFLLGFAISILLSLGFYWILKLWKGVKILPDYSIDTEIRENQIKHEKTERDAQIAVAKVRIDHLARKIESLKGEYATIQQRINRGQARIEELFTHRNKRVVDRNKMESQIHQFLNGWCRFVVHSEDDTSDVSAQIQRIKDVAYETLNQYYAGLHDYPSGS